MRVAKAEFRFAKDPLAVRVPVPFPVTVKPVVEPNDKVPFMSDKVSCSVPDVESETLIAFTPLRAKLPFLVTVKPVGAVTVGAVLVAETVTPIEPVPVRLSVPFLTETDNVSGPE